MLTIINIYSYMLLFNIVLYCSIVTYYLVSDVFNTLEHLNNSNPWLVVLNLLFVPLSLPVNLITFFELINKELNN